VCPVSQARLSASQRSARERPANLVMPSARSKLIWCRKSASVQFGSACKSSLGTAKKPRLDRTWTGSGPEIPRTGKDRNRGPVFSLSLLRNFEDRLKPVLTGLHSLKGEGHHQQHCLLLMAITITLSTTPQRSTRIEARDGGISTHLTPPSRVSTRWGSFDHSPMPPSHRNARRGHFYPPHTALSRFDAMGVSRPLPNAPLTSKCETGAFLPPLHLPLVFRCNGGVSTIPQSPPRVEMRDGGHFYPPHTSLSRFDVMEVFRPLPSAPLASKCETGAFLPTPHLPLAFRRDGGFRPFPNCPLASKHEMGGISTHPTPPSRVSTRCRCFGRPPNPPLCRKTRRGSFCTHPTPPSCVSTQWGVCNLLELN